MRRFSVIAMRDAATTGALPKIVVTQAGNRASVAGAAERPMPIATARPMIAVLRGLVPSERASLIPVMAIDANTDTVAPPRTA